MAVAAESEMLLTVDDPARELRGVRLHGELWKRGQAPEFRARLGGRAWELRVPRPATVDRLEYQLELVRAGGATELVRDPANPLRAPGPFGEKSVLEFPGYEPPAWLADEDAPQGDVRRLSLPSRTLGGRVGGLLWSPVGTERSRRLPLLVVHDGPEYAEYSSLVRLLDSAATTGELPPMRAALLAPVHRNEHYSAAPRYAAALDRELLPALVRLAPTPDEVRARAGMGASLGALAMLHAHRRHPDLFGGLFLQSGSFFRRRLDAYEASFPRFARITRFTGRLDRTEEWPHPVPVSLTCGAAEENLANNRATRSALAAQGYEVTLDERLDAHNWVSWRDALDPPLVALLRRLWG
jgi:enterochelin esterase-like enzyme